MKNRQEQNRATKTQLSPFNQLLSLSLPPLLSFLPASCQQMRSTDASSLQRHPVWDNRVAVAWPSFGPTCKYLSCPASWSAPLPLLWKTNLLLSAFFFKHMMTGVFRGFIGCVNPDGFILVWCYDITEQMVLKWHFWTDRNQEILETVSNVHILPLGFFFMFLCHPINLPHPKKRINNYQTFSFVTNLPLRLNHCVIHRCVTNLQQRTFQELEWFLRGFQISRKKTGNRIQ